MTDLRPVLRILGVLLLMFGCTMAVPAAASLAFDDGIFSVYPRAIGLAWICGLLLWWSARHEQRELQARHGIILVAFVWTAFPLFAALPLYLGYEQIGRALTWQHAYFEAVSGLTTTGATVLNHVDTLPVSLNIWRTFLQWMGGMGILILAVAILPMLGMGGSQLFRAEAAGPVKDTKLTPRMAETAKGLWTVYGVFSLACALAYWLAGMTPLDAIMLMFTTVSLGGLTPHDASFAYFNSPLIEGICIFFMLLASCNFALYFVALRKRRLSVLYKEPEVCATLGTLVGAGLVIGLILWFKGVYGPAEAVRHAVFNTVSVATTTGYATVDFGLWPPFAPVLMLLLSGVATSAGSTGGGIKMIRMLLLLKQTRREMRRLVHPNAVQPVTIGGNAIDERVIFSVLAFMLVYCATIAVLTMALLLTDMDFMNALGAVLASVNCAGVGWGDLGPSNNFAGLTSFQLSVTTLGMLMGRLEILSFLALLTPAFWRR